MLIPKTYPLLIKTIELGAIYGYRRAHKHTDNPTESELCSAMTEAILDEVVEAFFTVDPNNNKQYDYRD